MPLGSAGSSPGQFWRLRVLLPTRCSLLVSGRARFFILTPDGHKIVLMWLPVGEVIGGAALQSRPSDYIVSTETVKDCTLLVWDKASHPTVGHTLSAIAG